MNANRKAYALIGVSVAMIALQAAAVFGLTVGAQALWNSEPAQKAARAATVVATSVAGAIGQDGAVPASRFASRGPALSAPTVLDLSEVKTATVVSDDQVECYIVGPSGEVRKLDVAKVITVLETELCKELLEIDKSVLEVQRDVAEQMSKCMKAKITTRPTI